MKGLLSVLFSAAWLFLAAQTKTDKVNVSWGAEYKDSKRATLSYIAGHDETGIYTIKSDRGKILIEHYNDRLNQSKSVELDLKWSRLSKNLEFVLQLNNRLYLFSSLREKKVKKNTLFVQEVDKKTLKLKGEAAKVAEISYEGKSRGNSGNFDFAFSRDSSKLLIHYNLPWDRGEPEEFGFHVFDRDMKEIWKRQVTLPYSDELYEIEDYHVSNAGDVYILGVVYKEKRKSVRKGQPNYSYQVLRVDSRGHDDYPISVPGVFITDMQIAIFDNGDLVCAGFYSEEGTISIKGSMYLKIDGNTKDVITKSMKEFTLDFITQNLTLRQEKKTKKKAAKGKDVELYKYALDEIVLKPNGSAILVGEQFYIKEVVSYSTDANGNQRQRVNYYYNFHDIIAIKVNAEGEIIWTEKIGKRQTSVNDGGFYSSYTMADVDDKLFFIFNDNPKNLFYKGQGRLYNFVRNDDALVVLVELDANGRQTREAIFSADDAEALMRPKVCAQVSPREVVMFGQKRKTHRFARLTFK